MSSIRKIKKTQHQKIDLIKEFCNSTSGIIIKLSRKNKVNSKTHTTTLITNLNKTKKISHFQSNKWKNVDLWRCSERTCTETYSKIKLVKKKQRKLLQMLDTWIRCKREASQSLTLLRKIADKTSCQLKSYWSLPSRDKLRFTFSTRNS